MISPRYNEYRNRVEGESLSKNTNSSHKIGEESQWRSQVVFEFDFFCEKCTFLVVPHMSISASRDVSASLDRKVAKLLAAFSPLGRPTTNDVRQ